MKPQKPTLAEFKRFCKDVAPAAKAVLMARVHADMERERVDAYIRPIFQSYKFHVRAEWREKLSKYPDGVITEPKDLYLCNDDGTDGDEIRAYFEECDKAHRAHGFTGPQGHCPALTAEHLVVVTENALIDLARPLFGIDDVYGEDRKRYLELLIGACIKAESEAA